MKPFESLRKGSSLLFKKLHPAATLPSRGSSHACGLDLHSTDFYNLLPGERRLVQTGVAVEIPIGYYGRVAPRSGLAIRHGLDVLAGVIDPDYRGEIQCVLINLGSAPFEIQLGDRIAQLIIERVGDLDPVWIDELSPTNRSSEGFGSTGI